jgi:Protein of unknown function (DUF3987)
MDHGVNATSGEFAERSPFSYVLPNGWFPGCRSEVVMGTVTEAQAFAAVPDRGLVRAYLRWSSNACDCNFAYHLLGAYMLLTQLVPTELGFPFSRVIRPNLYGLAIGPSTASRKSISVMLVQDILREVAPDNIGSQPGSAEGLVDDLSTKPFKLISFPEFGAFLAMVEGGYASTIKTRLTDIYDCTPVARTKANGKGVLVDDPRLSIHGGVTPGFIEGHSTAIDHTEGFFARILFVYAKRERYIEHPAPSEQAKQIVIAMARDLKEACDVTLNGRTTLTGFTPAAKLLWREWQHKIEQQIAERPNHPTAPGIGRAPAMALKIATLLGWDIGRGRFDERWQIDDEVLTYATRMIDLHVQSVLELGETISTSPEMRDRRRVLNVITERPVTLGGILVEAKLLKRRVLDVLATLEEEGTVKRVSLSGVNGQCYIQVPEEDRPAARPEGQIITPNEALFAD